MKQAELFGMLLKLLGVWLVVRGLAQIPVAATMGDWSYLVLLSAAVLAPVIAGGLLVFFGRWISERCYGASIQILPLEHVEVFGMFVKVLGLWYLVDGISELPDAIKSYSEYRTAVMFVTVVLNELAAPLVKIIMGGFLFFGTRWLIGIAYGQRRVEEVAKLDRKSGP